MSKTVVRKNEADSGLFFVLALWREEDDYLQ